MKAADQHPLRFTWSNPHCNSAAFKKGAVDAFLKQDIWNGKTEQSSEALEIITFWKN